MNETNIKRYRIEYSSVRTVPDQDNVLTYVGELNVYQNDNLVHNTYNLETFNFGPNQ